MEILTTIQNAANDPGVKVALLGFAGLLLKDWIGGRRAARRRKWAQDDAQKKADLLREEMEAKTQSMFAETLRMTAETDLLNARARDIERIQEQQRKQIGKVADNVATLTEKVDRI